MHQRKPSQKYGWILAVVLLAAAYGLPALGVLLPVGVFVGFSLAAVLISLYGIRYITQFDSYREMYQIMLNENQKVTANAKTLARTNARKSIVQDTNITSNRKGFEFLNELFIKRHHKILWGPSQKISLVCAALIVGLAIAIMVNSLVKTKINELIFAFFPFFILIMYSINRGTRFTEALFMNCDHSLLSYSFYKQPKFILRLFIIRLREIFKVNIVPALVIGIGLSGLLYLSGGTTNPWDYVIISVSIVALSLFFSIHYLTLYYLLQPYNAGTELKSATYKIVTSVTYLVCYSFTQTGLEYSYLFGAGVIGFCLLYSIVASILVYTLAPKTFRIRS